MQKPTNQEVEVPSHFSLEEGMNHEATLIRDRMKTPRAAATAGILFSLLLIVSMLLLRSSVAANPMGSATEVIRHSARISLALNMLPFAGIAFLWFIAVMRDRLPDLTAGLYLEKLSCGNPFR